MSNGHKPPPAYVGRKRPDRVVNQPPAPGYIGLVMAGLTIGVLLLSIQLWLLTIALELYLAGEGRQVWLTALVSGAIFAGGLFMLRLLRRRPRMRGTIGAEGGAWRRRR